MSIELTDLTQAIWDTAKRIEKGVDILTGKAKAYAQKEKEYRISLAEEIVKLKTQGMSVTLIPDIAKGNVADKKFERDLAEETYKASRDMLQSLQAELTGLQSILKYQEKI